MKAEDFIIGIPSGHLGYVAFFNNFMRWVSGNAVTPVIAESNRVDVNRSQIIDVAKREKKNIIFIDADAFVNTSLPDVVKLAEEDFKLGDIIVAPVRGVNGNLLIRPMKKDFVYPQKQADFLPFEVLSGSFTFAMVSYKLIEKLKPLSYYPLVDNTRVPLYVAYTTQTSEEYAFCNKARKDFKSKIYCDPRLRVYHYKSIPLEPPLPVEEIEARRKLMEEKIKEMNLAKGKEA